MGHNKHKHTPENPKTNVQENPEVQTEETVQTTENQTKETENAPTEPEQNAEERLREAEERIADLEDKNLRMMAEFDNYRRRTNKEKLDLMETAGERIFADMLPLADDMERAMQAVEKSEDITALKEGMQLIYQKFLQFLAQNKVTPIETEGKDFSTDEHEAVTTFAAGEDNKGKIIDCTQKGYKLGEKVIRFAKVVVGE